MDLVTMRHDASGQEHDFTAASVPLRLRRGWSVVEGADKTPETVVAETPDEPRKPRKPRKTAAPGTSTQENTHG